MRLFKSREDKAQLAAGRAALAAVGSGAPASPDDVHRLAAELRTNPNLRALSSNERGLLADAAFRRYAEMVLADDVLDEDEEAALVDLAAALGVDQDTLETRHRPILNRLVVARVNDGRLPILDAPRLMIKEGEVVHLETPAALLKEVAIREYRGGYGGVSFRIAKGVRYHTGGMRGRSVVVGSELQTADTGVLSISSRRAVFIGTSKTIEFAYARLVNIEVFTDGIRFHVSNRQSAPLFRVESGDVVAAVLNAAAQRFKD
jgi:hypothetical protein